METAVELVLPLLGEAAGQTIRQRCRVAASDQLFDEQARHDGLAGAGSSASKKRRGCRGSMDS
jgi:hypothetical protein